MFCCCSTTQPAPHLDGIHVVFGQLLSGKEVVSHIEALPVDRMCRPLQDARVSSCGELVLRVKTKEKKKKVSSSSSSSSESSSEEESDSKEKKKKKKKDRSRKKDVMSSANESEDLEPGELHPLVTVTKIKADEIPDIPMNKFLLRAVGSDSEEKKDEEKKGVKRSAEKPKKGDEKRVREEPKKKKDERKGMERRSRGDERGREESRWEDGRRDGKRKRSKIRGVTKSGRVIKGRGVFRYRTPSRSRSRSVTPPHWRQAQSRTIKLSEYEKMEKERKKREEEIKRREEERKKRHQEREMLENPNAAMSVNKGAEETQDQVASEKPPVQAESSEEEGEMRDDDSVSVPEKVNELIGIDSRGHPFKQSVVGVVSRVSPKPVPVPEIQNLTNVGEDQGEITDNGGSEHEKSEGECDEGSVAGPVDYNALDYETMDGAQSDRDDEDSRTAVTGKAEKKAVRAVECVTKSSNNMEHHSKVPSVKGSNNDEHERNEVQSDSNDGNARKDRDGSIKMKDIAMKHDGMGDNFSHVEFVRSEKEASSEVFGVEMERLSGDRSNLELGKLPLKEDSRCFSPGKPSAINELNKMPTGHGDKKEEEKSQKVASVGLDQLRDEDRAETLREKAEISKGDNSPLKAKQDTKIKSESEKARTKKEPERKEKERPKDKEDISRKERERREHDRGKERHDRERGRERGRDRRRDTSRERKHGNKDRHHSSSSSSRSSSSPGSRSRRRQRSRRGSHSGSRRGRRSRSGHRGERRRSTSRRRHGRRPHSSSSSRSSSSSSGGRPSGCRECARRGRGRPCRQHERRRR
ncbi:peptidyl-prolyl cis-trans isomerase 1-like isoform X2 [Ischnura elegans]|uniref:peptidyl-prolyl cis-trans isomerase 1-like isoform X2 n=1 Tax=Ischnura elegans TaxID=197161 RepID=UPI001ED895BD|nr:peptidyl-prolyl cis-trans isomerase 1-like isoform X2 [Ischnura elegans]